MEEEIWKDIPGYEGSYQVSNLGRVKSLSRIVRMSHPKGDYDRPLQERMLKIVINNFGYRRVFLYKKGKSKPFFTHRLVGNTFIENPGNLPQINHIDGDKSNNQVTNLEWCSCSSNHKHAYKNGLYPNPCNAAKLDKKKVTEIRQLYSTGEYTQSEIANIYKVNHNTINSIINNRSWK